MKIAFYSNYLTHHQLPFCDSMYQLSKEEDFLFYFVSCSSFDNDRKTMGWKQYSRSYEIKSYLSRENYEIALNLASECDVMIFGSSSLEFLQQRINLNKITFRYSERLLKKGLIKSILNLDYFRFLKYNLKTRFENQYLLSASSFAPEDFRITGAKFKDQFKWGYFPPTKEYDIDELMKKKQLNTICWCGRMIPWKHPEIVLELAKYLKSHHIEFRINMIGNGELFESVQSDIEKNDLSNNIQLLGNLSSDKVRKYMEESKLFLFSSDSNEGWGAVINEAMNSGCVVFCSNQVGAQKYLIKEGYNGKSFSLKDKETLFKDIRDTLENFATIKNIGENAYRTIVDEWCAKTAAKRFFECSRKILSDEHYDPPQNGPMSRV